MHGTVHIKLNQMLSLSVMHFVNQLLHVSGTFVAHHQEVLTVRVCTAIGTYYTFTSIVVRRHVVAQWLKHCATNRKVAGSIPDGVIGIFH
jgi:hypothetical protein